MRAALPQHDTTVHAAVTGWGLGFRQVGALGSTTLLAAHGAWRIDMKQRPTLPLSGLTRRDVVGRAIVVVAALSLGSPLGRALAGDATPSAGPVEFLWETSGGPDSPLGNPAHLAIAPDGSIWVVDADNNQFQIFAPDGSFLETWGTSGSGDGEFDFTTIGWGGYHEAGIAFAPDGTVYVTDAGKRVQAFRVGDLPVAASGIGTPGP
jgi:hypothetical protein